MTQFFLFCNIVIPKKSSFLLQIIDLQAIIWIYFLIFQLAEQVP
jgi:hypothetical protein